MISTSDLQALIEKIDGGTKGVDLVKIGLEHYNGEVENFIKIYETFLMLIIVAIPRSPRRLRLALDIEGCLDRFYGGYYSGLNLFSIFITLIKFSQFIYQIGRVEDNLIDASNSFSYLLMPSNLPKLMSLSFSMEH